MLEHSNPRMAVGGLDDDEKGVSYYSAPAGGPHQAMNVVTESGLYSLIFTSRKPEAKSLPSLGYGRGAADAPPNRQVRYEG